MSLKRRLVAGTLALLVAGVVTTDVVTSSSLRSFLYGRLDEQIDVAQDTGYSYIETTYERALAADVPTATSDEGTWLAQWAKQRTSSVSLGGAVSPNTVATSVPTTGGASSSSPSGVSPGGAPRGTRLNADVLAARLGLDVYVEVIDGDGRIVFQRPSGSNASQDPAPILPSTLPVQASPPSHQFGTHHGAGILPSTVA